MSFEQRLENKDAYQKTLDFNEQLKIVKLLQQKFIREKNLSSKDAQILAWKRVREGSHVFEDYDDEKPPEVKVHSVEKRTIGLVSEEKKKLLKIYDLVKKICNKNTSENFRTEKYIRLEKYFKNLNKKIH